MIGYRQTLLVFLLTMLCGDLYAQTSSISPNNTNSPYTRYGYGQLADQGSGNSKAMGGIAYGLRDKYQVNFVNPASYTAVDSLTFIFDGGVSLQNTNFSNGTLKQNARNSSFDYVTMMFRASKWAAISIGLLPYSNVGYNMGETRDIGQVIYYGEGGLHQVYLGAGFKIFKNFSIGANISYLWGDISHTLTQSLPELASSFSYTRQQSMSFTSYKLDLGAQYTQQFGKKHVVTVGAVFSPGHDLNNDASVTDQTGNSSMGYTQTVKDTVATFGIPVTLGGGFTYVYDGRLTVGADVMYQGWSKVSFLNNDETFCNRYKVALGAEYLPNPFGRSYLANVKYRVGAYYSKPYYKIDGVRAANEYGVTAGFGLPIPRTRSILSVSAQYVRTEPTKSAFLTENTFRICVGVTFNERWFFKRKVN